MTVCIAALCCNGENDYIVTVSDTKLTTGIYSQDTAALKLRHLSNRWKCLIAGKFAQHRHVTDRLLHEFAGNDDKLTYGDVVNACTEAFVAENTRLAEEDVLSQYGMKMKDFVNSRGALGDTLYEKIWNDIARIRFGCDLLVCGFDKQHLPHVFIVSNPTTDNPSFITDCDFPGFGTIGTGSYLADSFLYGVDQSISSSVLQTIYNATSAKFLAESASDVGEETYLHIIDKEGGQVELPKIPFLESVLRKQWKKRRRPKIPAETVKTIREYLPNDLKP